MRKALVLLALVAIVGACSSDDSADVATEETTTTAEAPATSRPESTATAPAAPSAAECADPAGDTGGTGADLTKVTLARSGKNLTVTYDVAGEVSAPPDGASWVVVATRGSGDDFKQYHLGLKIVGTEVSRFIFDFAASQQTNLDTGYEAEGRRVVASFPVDKLPPAPFAWHAVTTSAGDDVDRCPAEGTLTFGS